MCSVSDKEVANRRGRWAEFRRKRYQDFSFELEVGTVRYRTYLPYGSAWNTIGCGPQDPNRIYSGSENLQKTKMSDF